MEKSFYYHKTKIIYRISGNGFPVVLVHGFAEDGNVWQYQTDFLKDHCRVIIPDLPGSGLSVFETDGVDTADNIEYYATCLHALLQQENIEKCIMIGHSMGGYITLAFAERYPQMLIGFGLVHSTAFADNDEKKQNRLKGIAMMKEYGGYAFIKSTTPNLFSTKFKNEQQEKVQELIEKGSAFSTVALQNYYTAMMTRPDRTAVLKDSEMPVLFVIGSDDIAIPMDDMLQQSHLPLTAYVHILKDAGHMGLWEDATAVNKALLAFVKALTEL